MATLFLCAGTLDWPRGWLFVVVYGAAMGALTAVVSQDWM